jgi:hypothetical protein
MRVANDSSSRFNYICIPTCGTDYFRVLFEFCQQPGERVVRCQIVSITED